MLDQGFNIFLENPQFLTIRAKYPNSKMVADFVLCRKESGSSDFRHPDRVEPGTIFDDLKRRDFTMNAIAECDETGHIIDPHGGILDLRQKLLRAVGNAEDRFNEDSLRILRAIRFSITKDLTIHTDIWQAFKKIDPRKLASVSTDRKREELNKMRLKSFYQLEFQFLYSADSKADYVTWLRNAAENAINNWYPFVDQKPSDRLPCYSNSTEDIITVDENPMELASMSDRTDFPDLNIRNVEIAISIDRLLTKVMDTFYSQEQEND